MSSYFSISAFTHQLLCRKIAVPKFDASIQHKNYHMGWLVETQFFKRNYTFSGFWVPMLHIKLAFCRFHVFHPFSDLNSSFLLPFQLWSSGANNVPGPFTCPASKGWWTWSTWRPRCSSSAPSVPGNGKMWRS